jgi:hypothetical protein
MRFNMIGFVLSDLIAKKNGLSSSTSMRDGLLGGMMGSSMMGVVLTAAISRNQEVAGGGARSGSGIGSNFRRPGRSPKGSPAVVAPSAANLVNLGQMPSFHGMTKDQVEEFAPLLGLQFEIEGTGTVSWQEPGVGTRPHPNNILKVKLTPKSL